jgi:hypothetical protein
LSIKKRGIIPDIVKRRTLQPFKERGVLQGERITKMKWILGFTAVAVLVGVAATITVPAQTVTLDEATLKLLPPETEGIAFVDVAGLRGAPLFNELFLSKLPPFPRGLTEFAQATGLEPQRDVDSVTVARTGEHAGVVLVRARYDKFKVEQYIKDKADKIGSETYLGRVIYTEDESHRGVPSSGESSGGVSFIDNLIVAGSLASVKQVIDRMAAPSQSVVDNADLMKQVRTIEAGNQVWAAGRFDTKMFGLPGAAPEKLGEVASALNAGTYQMRIDQDVHAKATGSFNSPEMAKAASDTLRGLLAMGKLQFAQEPTLTRLLDGASVEFNGQTLMVTFNASGDVIKQLQEMRAAPRVGQ